MSDYMRYNKEFPDDNIYETECPVIYALDILGQNGNYLSCGIYQVKILLDIMN